MQSHKPSSILPILSLIVFIFVCSFSKARIIYVPADFGNIQDAINDANNGDTVIVADGTYTGAGNRDISFLGKSITVQSLNGPNNCSINGQGNYRLFYFNGNEEPNSVLDGFTITNGSAIRGGGMYCQNSSPTITNCQFIGNTANNSGGGIYCQNSSPMITNCIFSNNSAQGGDDYGCDCNCEDPEFDCNLCYSCCSAVGGDAYGGGMFNNANSNPTLIDCQFIGNNADAGVGFPGIIDDRCSGCSLWCENSDGDASGGGIYNETYSSPTIINCTFVGNWARVNRGVCAGGGVYNGSYSNPTIINCTFNDNQAKTSPAYRLDPRPKPEWWPYNRHYVCANGFNCGGGIYNGPNSNPIVTNCSFNGNEAHVECTDYCGSGVGYGGGMYNDINSNSIITNCTFRNNTAGDQGMGGGIFNDSNSLTITDCTFTNNKAYSTKVAAGYGGGVMSVYESKTTISNCIFSNNKVLAPNGVEGTGGGLCAGSYVSDNLLITKCIFILNSVTSGSGGRGGGAVVGGAIITDCMFVGNTVSNFYWNSYGGGLYAGSARVTNCIFTGNSVHGGDYGYSCYGGGIYYDYHATIREIINCTFIGNAVCSMNSQDYYGGGVYSGNVTNCILWQNEPDQLLYSIATYSNIQGGWTGTGNINIDPCFAELGYWGDINDPNIIIAPNEPNAFWYDGNYRLLAGSPCIDAGDNNSVPEGIVTDLDGSLRVMDYYCNDIFIVDMGAYEFSTAYWGDFDYNCYVDFLDFALFAQKWLTERTEAGYVSIFDISIPPDNYIDEYDLAVFAENWLVSIEP